MLSTRLQEAIDKIAHYPRPTTDIVIKAKYEDWPASTRAVPVLVLRPHDEEAPITAGTITRGRPCAPAWLADSSSSSHFADVAVLNPEGIEGHYYRVLEEDGEGPLVRFESNRWNVISGPGDTPWIMGEGDFFSAYTMPHMFYVEVEAPKRTPRAGDMFGIHVEDGATLNPEVKDGELYCVTDSFFSPDVILLAYREPDRWSTLGHWTAAGWLPGLPPSGFPDFTTPSVYWASAKLGFVNALVNLPDAKQEETRLIGVAVVLEERERQINKDMNEVAREQGWCEQYEERIIDPLGLMHRKDEEDNEDESDDPDWEVTVTGTMRVEDSDPSGEIDEDLRNRYGWQFISTDSLSFVTGFRLIIKIEKQPDAEAAMDAVDESMIREELRLDLGRPHSTSFTITDWDATSAE
ncbi:hypothetical protein FDH86_gp075 [Arthrobacter phage Tank]|uniref:Uncharacterized protein n=1 Tax=Arthrobacter phage Tank TaxID=1772319 RepID=A0A0U4K294_9CAUD|nr:hypothetical protein FDH86_gp075 [Arthrobacter phage Tank]ALY10610.1 hypothetical protein TANK_75 [Arthrobacter phage Tank]